MLFRGRGDGICALGGRAPVNSPPGCSVCAKLQCIQTYSAQTARSRSRLHPRFPPPFSCIKNTPPHSCAAACFWYSRRESNPQRPLRRGLLYPFNYGSIIPFLREKSKNTSALFGNANIIQYIKKKIKQFSALYAKPAIINCC